MVIQQILSKNCIFKEIQNSIKNQHFTQHVFGLFNPKNSSNFYPQIFVFYIAKNSTET